MFEGLITALITPFKDNNVDYDGFRRLLKYQTASQVHGLVVLGSTGEAATLSDRERAQVITCCIETIRSENRRIPIIVGTGSNCTTKTSEYTKQAQELGADAALVVCPYYNKPSQEGMYAHFKYINDNINFPFFLYNVPGRTIVNLSDNIIAKLAKLENIIGIKDATGDLTRPLSLKQMLTNNKDFIQISGEDATAVAFNLSGGRGCISVLGNILPKKLANIQNLTLQGKYREASEEMSNYQELADLMFCETNPVPIKYALYKTGIISSPEVRLPLLPLTGLNRTKVDDALRKIGLIK